MSASTDSLDKLNYDCHSRSGQVFVLVWVLFWSGLGSVLVWPGFCSGLDRVLVLVKSEF